MASGSLPTSSPALINTDALIDLAVDVVRLAVRDARRGPGRQLKTQRRYASAVEFLQQLGMLDRVAERYGLDPQSPYQPRLIED